MSYKSILIVVGATLGVLLIGFLLFRIQSAQSNIASNTPTPMAGSSAPTLDQIIGSKWFWRGTLDVQWYADPPRR